jgi:hypothetical protein
MAGMYLQSLEYLVLILSQQVVLPVGVPHVSIEDDIYEGYFIPKGTTFMVNAWYVEAIH